MLQQWTLTNEVTINFAKTMVMHINLGEQDNIPPTVTLGPDTLQVVQTAKLFDVSREDELTGKAHIVRATKAASTCSGDSNRWVSLPVS